MVSSPGTGSVPTARGLQPYGATDSPRHRQSTPRDEVLRNLQLHPALKALVPRGWKRIGDVVIVRLASPLEHHGAAVGKAFARALGLTAVLQEVGHVRGERREPGVKFLHGDSAETIHRENGLRYALDASRIMFSPGNLVERIRMGRVARPGEVVVDMFAGIGYFTLPMAFHGRAKRVYACEISPVAHGYLRHNLVLNQLENVTPLLGDCRATAPHGVADRTVMGWLWGGPLYLPAALATLKPGGVLHYHSLRKHGGDARPEVETASEEAGRGVEALGSRRVKDYAPGVVHMVEDFRIR